MKEFTLFRVRNFSRRLKVQLLSHVRTNQTLHSYWIAAQCYDYSGAFTGAFGAGVFACSPKPERYWVAQGNRAIDARTHRRSIRLRAMKPGFETVLREVFLLSQKEKEKSSSSIWNARTLAMNSIEKAPSVLSELINTFAFFKVYYQYVFKNGSFSK